MLRKIRHLTKYFFLAAAGALLLALVSDFGTYGGAAGGGAPEAITVAGEGVKFETLHRIAENFESAVRAEGARSETEVPRAALRRATEEIVDRLVVLALAEEIGTAATEAEITREFVRRYATNPDGSRDMAKFRTIQRDMDAASLKPVERQLAEEITYLKTYLAVGGGSGVTEPMLRAYHDARYARLRVRSLLVRPTDFITAEAARAVYDARSDTYFLPERATFRALLFAPTLAGEAGAIEARERAFRAGLLLRDARVFDAVYRAIEADTDPATEARRLEDIPRANLAEFETAIWLAPPGRPTEPIPAAGGAYAILLTDRRDPRARRPFEKVVDDIREELAGDAEWEAARTRILAEAARADSVANLAAAEDLGWLTVGEIRAEDLPDTRARERILATLVPPGGAALDRRIEAALLSLAPGRASGIVRTARGYHLLYLEGRRPADAGAAMRRMARLREDLLSVFRKGVFNALIRQARSRFDIERNDYLLSQLEE